MIPQIEKIQHNIKEIREFANRQKKLAEEQEGLAILIEQETEGILTIENNNNKLKPLSISEIEKIFGKFEYSDIGNGRIRIDGDWEYRNCKLYEFNGNKYYLNKRVAPQFFGFLIECINEGYEDEVAFRNGGGIFCTRHRNWDIDRPLSYHSWAIAFDTDPEKYPYGSNIRHSDRVVEIANRWGWYYGGDFTNLDPMHFEFARFII